MGSLCLGEMGQRTRSQAQHRTHMVLSDERVVAREGVHKQAARCPRVETDSERAVAAGMAEARRQHLATVNLATEYASNR